MPSSHDSHARLESLTAANPEEDFTEDTDVIVFPREIPIPPEFLTPEDKEKRAVIARAEAAEEKLEQISALIEKYWPIDLIDAVPRNPFDQKAKQITKELRAILAP